MSPRSGASDRSAATRYAPKIAGPLSAASSATNPAQRYVSDVLPNHSVSKVVLPNPAGAEIRVSAG